MKTKDQLRKKFSLLRKNKYFDVSEDKFDNLISYIKKRFKTKKKFLLHYITLLIMKLMF